MRSLEEYLKHRDDRRKSARDMCSDFVQIAWLDQAGRRISCLGILEDVSPKGLGVSMELPVPQGHTVHLHTKGLEGEALVRYCVLGDYGYVVGLEFLDGCSWDREKWRPKHLLTRVGVTD